MWWARKILPQLIPEPFILLQACRIDLATRFPGKGEFVAGQRYRMDLHALQAGMYLYRVADAERQLKAGKLLVR